ncbi:MAG: hypothetical protein GQ574_19335 [Crocinitomix sp.]|nr:hypothetical protein [Crocinitomix sp.]
MKHLFLVLLLALQGSLFANMREPVDHGTVGSRPFTSKYVDILHEELNIVIDSNFKTASFEVIYTVSSAKAGSQIPLLFYASEYLDDFKVFLDGKAVNNVVIPNYDGEQSEAFFVDYPYFFEEYGGSSGPLDFNKTSQYETSVTLSDLIYFEVALSEGEHQFKVTYSAHNWTDFSNSIKAYDFRYSLSPANYWKSFGVLDLTIDASAFDQTIETNLGEPQSGDINNVGYWSFEGIPVSVIEISFRPEIGSTAQFFLNLGGLNLALIIGFIFAVFHLVWMHSYRRNHPDAKYSVAVIVGVILVPLIFILTWIFSFDFFAYLIGPDASDISGYRFMSIIGYPILIIPYFLIAWGFDKIDKRKLAKK